MTFLVADRVQETTNSPGTGTATLLGAVSGYQSFSTGIGANNTTFYVIADQLGTNWEVGLGALNSTGTVLTRTTVYSSSNGGSTVNFATGTQYVWCDFPASQSVFQGAAANFSSIGATTAGTGAFTNLSYTGTLTGGTGIVNLGSGQFYINGSGNVGIGTSSPTEKLMVAGGVYVAGSATLGTTGTVGLFSYEYPTIRAYIGDGSGYSWAFSKRASSTTTDLVTIQDSGYVGIGTSSPATILNVYSTTGTTANFASSIQVNNNSYTAGTYAGVLFQTGDTLNSYVTSIRTGSYGGVLAFGVNTGTSGTSLSEAMRIDSSGNLLIGTTYGTKPLTVQGGSTGGTSLQAGFGGINATSFQIYHADAGGQSGALTVQSIAKVASSGRSINAAGTINALGTDYAEYMVKADNFVISKGDICGIDANGKLTNVFIDSISFAVKSTNPSYVGGDSWGDGFEDDAEGLEQVRQTVDRIAFSGQVPVNVLNAIAGQYIIPVNENGSIKGEAVSNPTFEQYQIAVGKVIAIEADGRAKIIVKVA